MTENDDDTKVKIAGVFRFSDSFRVVTNSFVRSFASSINIMRSSLAISHIQSAIAQETGPVQS